MPDYHVKRAVFDTFSFSRYYSYAQRKLRFAQSKAGIDALLSPWIAEIASCGAFLWRFKRQKTNSIEPFITA